MRSGGGGGDYAIGGTPTDLAWVGEGLTARLPRLAFACKSHQLEFLLLCVNDDEELDFFFFYITKNKEAWQDCSQPEPA